ncbi:MAG: protease pro-enzyme activation domain-containing protein [Acidobacteriota bacterium]|nr:protease pro-enzyme activation domain-containing protein [Acidobacteriota bacterium]
MRSRLISRLLLPAILLFTGFSHWAQAAVQNQAPLQNRIASIESSRETPLPGTVSGRALRASDLGAAPADRKLDSITMFFSMTPAQQADLNQLLAAQLDPASPSYHQWLTPQQFGARFGLSSADLSKVSTWIARQGFTIIGTAPSANSIQFTGTVAQAQQAFGVTIHSLSSNGEQHISNLSAPVLPSAISSVVTSITGLNDFRMRPHSRVRNITLGPSQPRNTQSPGGKVQHFIAPGDLYTIYDFPPFSPTAGAGITIAVIGQTALNTGNVLPDPDVTAFRTAGGLPSANLQIQLAGSTDPGVQITQIDEAHLDVEWSGAAAPGATILYVYGSDAFADALYYVVMNKVAPIVSSSYGGCETEFNSTLSISGQSELLAYNNLLAQANAQGMTIVNASGDSGAADCDNTGVATQGLNVDFPASSPYVTAAGGTMFSGDLSSPGTFWTSSNGANGGSALGYISEQPWNATSTSAGLSAGGSSGGGASAFFAKPSWQMGTGAGATPNDSSRDVPDFSLNAAPDHDGYFVCTSGSSTQDLPCTNGGFLDSTGNPNVFGGTSFVAPIFAGILAQLEQHLNAGQTAAKGLGNINNILYGLANGPTYSSIFHDVTTGNNAVSCAPGTPNCSSGGTIGFSAGTGYDQATGLGSLDVASLINSWSTATPTGTGGTIVTGISSTTLSTTGSLCAVTSGSLALTVAVSGSISNATPTGTIQFFVDGAPVSGSSTALASNGTATYTLATSTLSSGGHTVSAVYSGDTNYAGSKGTLLASNGSIASVDIVSSTKADFSITPCSAAVSVSPGATSSGIVFTITPVNGFTGPVTLTATNNDDMIATTSFTPPTLTITSGAGTTSFVVVASQPSGTASVRSDSVPASHPSGKSPWYAAGSGATLACVLLFTLPRRRRWGALLIAVLSVAALAVSGCSNTSTTGNTTPPPPPNVTPASKGTYTYTITGTGANGQVHSAQVTVTVP